MSEMSDRLKQLDEQHQNIISQAMTKNSDENAGPTPPQSTPPRPSGGGGFSFAIFVLFLLMIVTIVVVVLFSYRTMDKVSTASRAGDQLEVLLEDHVEEYQTLDQHVKAMEMEFRKAFKKDRVDMAAMKEELVNQDNAVSDDFNKQMDDLRNDVLKYKSTVADNEAKMSQVNRKYDDLMARFTNIQDELKRLRLKVTALTAPPIPEQKD